MRKQSRKNQWKSMLAGALVAACVAVPFVTTAHAQDADDVQTNEASLVVVNPTQISGTVEKYYTDRSGLLTALDLNTGSAVQKVRFKPSWGNRLWTDHPTGSTLDGWIVEGEDGIDNLVAIGAERPNRFLDSEFHTGTERLLSTAWIWNDAATETVSGELNKVIVSEKGEVLALELKDGTLIRVPMTVKHQEQGAQGTKQVAQLFKGAQVTAWGPQVWGARGDVSIYGQRIAATGLSINGKTVSAIGIQNLPANSSLLGTVFDQTKGDNGEFSEYDASMQKYAPAPTMKDAD